MDFNSNITISTLVACFAVGILFGSSKLTAKPLPTQGINDVTTASGTKINPRKHRVATFKMW